MQIQLTFGSKGPTDDVFEVFVQHISCSQHHAHLGRRWRGRSQRCSQSPEGLLFTWGDKWSPQETEASEDRGMVVQVDHDGGGDEEWGERRGREKPWRLPGPGLGQEEGTVQGGAGTSPQECTEHPVGSPTGAGGRGCLETVGRGGAGVGSRLGRAIRAWNVVHFLSAGFHDSPLSLMFCSLRMACPGVNLFTSPRTQHTFSNSEPVSSVLKSSQSLMLWTLPFPTLSSLLQNSLLNANWVFLI